MNWVVIALFGGQEFNEAWLLLCPVCFGFQARQIWRKNGNSKQSTKTLSGQLSVTVNRVPLWGLYVYQDQRQESAEGFLHREEKNRLDYLQYYLDIFFLLFIYFFTIYLFITFCLYYFYFWEFHTWGQCTFYHIIPPSPPNSSYLPTPSSQIHVLILYRHYNLYKTYWVQLVLPTWA